MKNFILEENCELMIFTDKNLSQKLERTEARSNVDFVKARVAMFPSSGANALFSQIYVRPQIDYLSQQHHTN